MCVSVTVDVEKEQTDKTDTSELCKPRPGTHAANTKQHHHQASHQQQQQRKHALMAQVAAVPASGAVPAKWLANAHLIE